MQKCHGLLFSINSTHASLMHVGNLYLILRVSISPRNFFPDFKHNSMCLGITLEISCQCFFDSGVTVLLIPKLFVNVELQNKLR